MINNSIPLGGLIILEKVNKEYGFFSEVFKGTSGRMKTFIPLVKLIMYNKLTHSVSIHQILETYSDELLKHLGMKEKPGERSLYRILERLGKNFPIIHERYQSFIKKQGLVDKTQMVDFSSTYFEGKKSELSEYGRSSDKRPDKPQVRFGISTGINDIPTALTIQKGNTADKDHIKSIIKLNSKISEEKTLYIFDAGANVKEIKNMIRKLDSHYLTRKQKNVKSYKKYIKYFNENEKTHVKINRREYFCVKKDSFYIYFSPDLYSEQMKSKEKTFVKQKEKGNKTLKKRKHQRLPSDKGWIEFIPSIQRTLSEIENPYITGIEGFLILESSVDEKSEKILKLYKERDKAEKFIRNLKEGLELRPLRHWNKFSVIGMMFISFLTNFLINLTLKLAKKPLVKNVKLLKKFLINLTLTVVYPKNKFRFSILSNVSPQIISLFDDFLEKYHDKSLELRW